MNMRGREIDRNPNKNSDLRSLMKSKEVVARALIRFGLAPNSVKLEMSSGVYGGMRHKPNKQTDPPGASPDFELPDDSYKRIGM